MARGGPPKAIKTRVAGLIESMACGASSKGADLAVADLPYFEAADFGFGDFAAHAGGFGG